MFERRLKIFLAILGVFTMVLLLRAGQVQVVEHDQWSKAAADSMRRSNLVGTVRGGIRDRKGRALAVDEPCVDVCVDYRAITTPPDPRWVAERAEQRLKGRLADEWDRTPRARRRELVAAEVPVVERDIAQMWADLPRLSARPPEQVAEVRQAILSKVAIRRDLARMWVVRRIHRQAEDREDEAFWRRWLAERLVSEKADDKQYQVPVSEEVEAHVVLRAVDDALQNALGKRGDRYPGLELRPSTHRVYPLGTAGCHLMGRVTRVTKSDVEDPDGPREETRQYLPNDDVGRGGVEGLFEPVLRGSKGKVERMPGQQQELSRVDPRPGRDVRVTVDAGLQERVEAAFVNTVFYDNNDNRSVAPELHGGAVVIDVPTGEVLALASYPTFDMNALEESYHRLADDDLNQPLLNRATMAQLQPGSTMKPLVGLGAITQGVVAADAGIECTGFVIGPNGKPYQSGRCWVESKFGAKMRAAGMSAAHHPIPVPHPTGFLTFGDALERSCNVYFETLADRMGLEGLSVWGERFGLGRPTGVGIAEGRGRLPRSYLSIRRDGPPNPVDLKYKALFSGIGQDPVAATPIQMANVAATIARGGVWRRPRLVSEADAADLGVKLPRLRAAPPLDPDADDDGRPDAQPDWPDAYDLNLSPAALAAARDGMRRVVVGAAGTGKGIVRHAPALAGLAICGKTGTAQAPKYHVKQRDPATGKVLLDERGRATLVPVEAGDKRAPWILGGGQDRTETDHAWYIGFAPADRPQVAFAVMVEYGGSGGMAAAAVARETLAACIELGYLTKGDGPAADAGRGSELLRDVAAGR